MLALILMPLLASAARLKDIVDIEGVRQNQLIGYGLVVGLAGTGDKQTTIFSNQSLTNMLERMGVAVSPTAILVKNTAAVMVTATLPPFAQPGTRIDVTVAAIGDAANLQGGILILTSLRGAGPIEARLLGGDFDARVVGVARGARTRVRRLHSGRGRKPIHRRHHNFFLALRLHRADGSEWQRRLPFRLTQRAAARFVGGKSGVNFALPIALDREVAVSGRNFDRDFAREFRHGSRGRRAQA